MEQIKRDKIVNAIKKRESIRQTFMSIRKLLALNNMEQYANICVNRMVRDNVCDSEFQHVIYNYLEDDFLVDLEGIEKVEYILKGYISSDMMSELKNWVRLQDSLIEAMNDYVELLRNTDEKVLKNLLSKKAVDYDACTLIRIELKARRQANKLFQSVRRMAYKVKLHVLSWCIIFGIKSPVS